MEKTTNHSPITQKHCATVKAPSAKDFRSRGYKMGFGPYSSTRLRYSRLGYYVVYAVDKLHSAGNKGLAGPRTRIEQPGYVYNSL